MTNSSLVGAPRTRPGSVCVTLRRLISHGRRAPGLPALVALYLFAAASARTPLTATIALLMLSVFALRVHRRTRSAQPTTPAVHQIDQTAP